MSSLIDNSRRIPITPAGSSKTDPCNDASSEIQNPQLSEEDLAHMETVCFVAASAFAAAAKKDPFRDLFKTETRWISTMTRATTGVWRHRPHDSVPYIVLRCPEDTAIVYFRFVEIRDDEKYDELPVGSRSIEFAFECKKALPGTNAPWSFRLWSAFKPAVCGFELPSIGDQRKIIDLARECIEGSRRTIYHTHPRV